MHRLQAFVADEQALEAVQPGDGALDHPAMATEPGLALDALAGDTHLDAPPMQIAAAAPDIVALVGVQFLRALARSPAPSLARRERLDQSLEDRLVGAIRAGERRDQRDALAVDYHMVLGAGFAPVGRVFPGRLAPLFWRAPALCWCARTIVASSIAYSLSASALSAAKTRCHTPLAAQRRKR